MEPCKKRENRIRFGIIGSGWRALFYVRAAKALPEQFELTGVVCHTKDKAQAFAAEHGDFASASLEELLKTQPEFVICCVNKDSMAGSAARLMEAGMPVLCETPLATHIGTLRELYAVQRRTGTLLELAEQYFLYPTHQARRALIDAGMLGHVTGCQLSMVHDYHAVSLFRFYLGDENGRVDIRANRQAFPILITGGREGYVPGRKTGEETRVMAQFAYADGRLAAYDFAGTQYHSAIRSSHIRILGTRGEIFDREVRCLGEDGRPLHAGLTISRDAMTGTLRAIDFEGRRVYQNPFGWEVPLSEEDIAVCGVLERMGRSVRGGRRHYPLAHAFRDAYMACLMQGAAEEDGRIHTVDMDWD